MSYDVERSIEFSIQIAKIKKIEQNSNIHDHVDNYIVVYEKKKIHEKNMIEIYRR